MTFKNYTKKDYEAVCDYLIELNRCEKHHINWNWARFEWMTEHPEFDKTASSSIGLWKEDNRVVGAAIYDMYFGEAFCGVLSGYEELYPEILEYAYRELKDDAGLGISIGDENTFEVEAAKQAGFVKTEQTETVMSIYLNKELTAELMYGLRIVSLDPKKEPYDFQWLLWQGFDHGTDREEFEKTDPIIPAIRRHLIPYLSIAAENTAGEKAAYCCLWYSEKTDYVYVEPVCTIPSYRGRGVAKALLYEALNRARTLGAEKAYVISDAVFYEKLGFHKEKHFTFYWKE